MARSEQTEGLNEERHVTIARARRGTITTKARVYRREGCSIKERNTLLGRETKGVIHRIKGEGDGSTGCFVGRVAGYYWRHGLAFGLWG